MTDESGTGPITRYFEYSDEHRIPWRCDYYYIFMIVYLATRLCSTNFLTHLFPKPNKRQPKLISYRKRQLRSFDHEDHW